MSVSTSKLPLLGKTILVTRAAEQSSQFGQLLRQVGATIIEMPALEIRPPSSWDAFDRAIAQMADIDWLILTSANGVNYFFQRLSELGHTVHDLEHLKIAVVGRKTAACLEQMDIHPHFIPPDYVADSLVSHFPDHEKLPNLKILFPRVESGGREVLVNELTTKGAAVIEVPAYQSCCPRAIAPPALDALQQGKIDVVTFASSKTVRYFCQLIAQSAQVNVLRQLDVLATQFQIASIGPQTSQTCYQLLGRVDIEAQQYTLDGLTSALVDWAVHV
ncbi:MAG: uroporphyrinogen-III synthase [Cyanobacteria bacterium P01_E01_bin.6]